MVRNEFTFLSADGATQLHGVFWLPEGQPRALLQIAHGVAEYILRYEDFAAYLTEQGFAVVGHDHLGHGASVPPGSPALYFGPKGSWNWVVDDMASCRRIAKERFPRLPYFLLGHSMGSFLARCYLIRYPGTVDGAVIMGTGQMPPALLMAGRAVATVEGWRIGPSRPSALVNKLAFGSYNRTFSPHRTAYDWISLNTDNVDRYIADPLCAGIPSAGLFREMLGGMAFMASPKHLAQMDLSTPILFISGDRDPVGGFGQGVRQAWKSFREAGVKDLTLKLYPELRHEILNESSRKAVYEDVYCWLKARLPASP